jgi:uncharacterized protein involved in outer membrane biogenesis
MKTLPKIALGAVAALLVLIICLLLYILFGDLSVHKDRILNAASDATGFHITSTGPFDLDVARKITLSAENITIGNPAWPDEHALTTASALHVVVDTWSILSGPIEIDSLAISGAHVNLKSSEDERANWIPAAVAESEDDASSPGPGPLLHKIALDDVRISHERAGEMLFFSETSTLRMSRIGHNQYDYELDQKLDEAELSTSGSLRFAAGIGAVTNARIELDEAMFSQSGATEASASFSGFIAADLSTDRPAIEVDINISLLNVGSDDAEQSVPSDDENKGDLLFDTTPLAYSWFDTLDLAANITIAKASLNGNELSELHVVTKIEDAALTVEPIEFVLGEGKFMGSLKLTPANDTYDIELEANVENLRLAQLADDNQDPATVPPLNATLSLRGDGASLHDIMASSNGRLSGRQGGGHLNLQAAGALFSDFLTSTVRAMNPMAEDRTYTVIECGVFNIDITDGVANIEEFALQSDRLTIISSGNVNLETEALGLMLSTKPREGLGVSVGNLANSFIKLGGTLTEPALGLDAAGSVTTAGAAIATGGLSLLAKGLWDRVSSGVDMCAQEEDTPAPN